MPGVGSHPHSHSSSCAVTDAADGDRFRAAMASPPSVDLRWTYLFEREGVPELEHQLEWALQSRNAAFTRMYSRQRSRMVMWLSGLGCALIVLMAVLDRAPLRTHAARA